jgi:hypothetical protein
MMEKFILTEDDFKIVCNGRTIQISVQVGDTYKSCTLSEANIKAMRQFLRAASLPGKLAKAQLKIKKALLNKDWYPTKAMFDLDFERCRTIVRLQHTLSDLHKILSEYNDQHKKQGQLGEDGGPEREGMNTSVGN